VFARHPGGIHEHIGWLQVLVDQTTLVQLAVCRRETSGDAQKLPHSHRSVNEAVKRFATRVLKHKYSLVVVVGYGEGSNCPCRVQFAPQEALPRRGVEQS